jgi:glycyl-tRNA synthetase (class II)
MASQEDVFKKLIAHCKEYGFVFPSSEIYDGLGAVYDYGQNGVELKNNIKKYWWDSMVLLNENVVGILPPGKLRVTWMRSTTRLSTTKTARKDIAQTC